jgi:hypothetical protein
MSFATIPENILKRYLGAKALAEKGATEGERVAARNAMSSLEAKHPTIRIEAAMFEQVQQGDGPSYHEEPRRPPPPPPRAPAPTPTDPNFGPYTASSGNWGAAEKKPVPGRWGSVMDAIGQAWDVAKEVTEGAVNAEAGRVYAEQSAAVDVLHTAAGNSRYAAVLTTQALNAAKYRFNDVQKQAFAKRIGEKVAERIYAFLSAP